MNASFQTRLSLFPILFLVASSGLAATTGREPKKTADFVNALARDLEPTRTVVYKKVGDRELSLHIFEPAGHKPTDKRACFIAIHGGGWVGGEPRRFYPFAAHFAKLGMVGVSVQYRLVKPGSGITPFQCVKDGRSAVRYVRAHAAELGIDPQKIIVSGGSAGGHVAAGTALFDGIDEGGEDTSVSSVPNALVLYFPVIDTSPEGYGNAKCGPQWREISPLHRAKAGLPPTILFHGTADTTTPFQGAKLFHEAMLKAGNRCELIVHEGGKHGYLMFDRALYDEALGKTERFLASLGFLAAAPSPPTAAAQPPARLRADFLALCDAGCEVVVKQAHATERMGRAFYWDSYVVRALCVAYDLTGKRQYLDATKLWSDRMIEYQNGMIPRGAFYMQYGRKPGEEKGNWYVADCSSIALGVLATAIRCADPVEKCRYLDAVQSFARLVAENFVRPSGGVTDGYWPKSDKEWWCSTGIFGSLAFCLYDETGDPSYLRIGLGTIDWLNQQELLTVTEFFPPKEIRPTVWMYCLEAYSAGRAHLKPGSKRHRAAMAQWAIARDWMAKNSGGRAGIDYVSQWGSKLGGLPFHLYVYAGHVSPNTEVVKLADEELRHIASVLEKAPASNQRDQLALFAMLSYAEKISPGSIYRISKPAGEPFDYFCNSWSVVGLKDYNRGTRVTPANELLLDGGAKVTLHFGSKSTPLSRRQTKTLMDGWLPIILLTAEDGPVRYDFTLWATPLPTVKDWQKAFDWPTEGENFLNWIMVKATNTGATPAEAKVKVEQRGKTTAATEALAWKLEPGKSAEGVVRMPFSPVAVASAFAQEDAKLWLERTAQYWQGVMEKAARIEVPCRKATEALLAAHVCQLIASDHGELHGGEGFYDQFYIRDGGYQIMELEEAGLADAAAKAVEFYLRRQRPDGRFETQKNQFDANGQALWVLWQYFKITGDRPWLEKAYPQMRQAVDWMMKARREAPADSPFVGVLPAAPADGEFLWDGKHHIVGYDLWNLRGLLCTADAARSLGKTPEAEDLLREAAAYRSAIDAAWKRAGLAHFPPSWEKDGTHWGNTETLWPTELFARDDPRVTALIEHARREHGGGFIEGTLQWLGRKDAIHPYLSAYTTMASLVRGEHEQVVEDFYWYLLHSTATHAFPEGIFYKRRFAWSDTIPHVTGASNYALMLRHMLVHEAGDELHLLAAVPDWWLEAGKQIRVERAPTHFGLLSLTVRGTAQGVEVQWEPPRRQPPKRVLLHLPRARPLVGSLPGVEVVLRSDQKRRWDFPTVVKLYKQQAPPLLPP